MALAFSFLAAPGCRPAEPAEGEGVVPELKLEGVRFRVYREGALRALGEAGVATFRRDSTDLSARDVVATLPRGSVAVRIAAPSGAGVVAARVFSAEGGVTVTRGDDVARTERARYAPSASGEGLVTGDRPVVVEGRGYRLEGAGFTLDPERSEIAVRGGASLVAGVRGAR